MGAVSSPIIDKIERATLSDTAPMTVGAIATDAMVSVADERLNFFETAEEFNELPIGLMGDDDRYGGRIVGRHRYGVLVEGRAPPGRIESCSIFSIGANVHQIATVFRGVVTSISMRCVSSASISSTGYFPINVLSAASWLLGCAT